MLDYFLRMNSDQLIIFTILTIIIIVNVRIVIVELIEAIKKPKVNNKKKDTEVQHDKNK